MAMNYANPYELIDRRLSAIELALQKLRQQNNGSTLQDEVGGIELAKAVTRLSAARIYTLVSERKLPHKKRGNRLTFRRSELLAWLDDGHRAPATNDSDFLPFDSTHRKKGGRQ